MTVDAVALPTGVTIYFVRHGETDWNKTQRYQGQTDIPLNETGRQQAARNGQLLRELLGTRMAKIDYVASPLLRTAETMRIARTAMGLAPDTFRRDDRLKEQHFGHWEGQLWTELPVIDPDGFAARKADTWNWVPRGGESYAVLVLRVRPWLASIKHDTVVVSHGNISRTVRGLVLGLDEKTIPKLEVPQDKVLRLQAGTGEWL
jgi:broad specificity phosphatase PhoE